MTRKKIDSGQYKIRTAVILYATKNGKVKIYFFLKGKLLRGSCIIPSARISRWLTCHFNGKVKFPPG